MTDQFDEAPPLPRGLTNISMPSTGEQHTDDPSESDGRPSPPPPPKFPSLTDVGLPHAQSAAAAAAGGATAAQTPPPPAPAPSVVPASAEGQTSAAQTTIAPDTLDDAEDAADHDALQEDISAAIQRDAVAPGTGARRASEIARDYWTSSDQEELDRLLAEGQDVYVPPDVGVGDLPVARASGYAYVPVPPTPPPSTAAAGVDASPDQRSMADRIAVWNQVVPKENIPFPNTAYFASGTAASASAAAASAAAAADTGTDPPSEDATHAALRSAPVDQSHFAPQAADESAAESKDRSAEPGATDSAPASPIPAAKLETPVKSAGVGDDDHAPSKVTNADVSRTIFGGTFYTVPVVSRKYMQVDKMTVANTETESQPATTQDVLLKANSTAKVKVVEDFGLKGGHDSVINDAAFMHGGQTLVTCGADGKVCIWDMSERSVQREFVPNEGESVTMVYPLPDDDEEPTSTIMTLSESRTMRIWCVDETQAVMLRTNQIKASESDLYMSVPVISKQLKARAIAAAAAAAVQTSDTMPEEVGATSAEVAAVGSPAAPSTAPTSPVPSAMTPPSTSKTTGSLERVRSKDANDDEKERRRFSLKMFTPRGGQRRAMAS